MSYNANYDNGNQEQDRGLKETFQKVQSSFTSEGDYNGAKIVGGLAGVAALGGLGYVGYNQWLQHQGKDDSPDAAQEFKNQAKPVAVDPQSGTATVVHDQSAANYGETPVGYGAAQNNSQSGYGATGGYGSANNSQSGGYGNQNATYGSAGLAGAGGYGQQQQQPQEDHSKRNTALAVLGGLAGVAAVGGVGYVGYKEWLEHKQKEDNPQAAQEFKQEAKPVEVNPQTQSTTVVGDQNAQVSNQYQQAIAAGGYTGTQVNVNGGSGCNGVQWQVQYGDKPFPSNTIRGGQESDGTPLYVARTKHTDGSLQPGKAGPSTGGGCLYAWGGRELYSSVFEVLVGDQNAVKWVGVSGNAQPNGWSPIEAGKDSDGSPLYVAKADYEGSCQPGKAGPSLGEGLIGWGGEQRKVQNYQVLARA